MMFHTGVNPAYSVLAVLGIYAAWQALLCYVGLLVLALLRRSRSLMCFSPFMQNVEFIMPLSVALVSFRFVWFEPVSLL